MSSLSTFNRVTHPTSFAFPRCASAFTSARRRPRVCAAPRIDAALTHARTHAGASPSLRRRRCVTDLRAARSRDDGSRCGLGAGVRYPEPSRRQDEAQQGRRGAIHRFGAGLCPVTPGGERAGAMASGRAHGGGAMSPAEARPGGRRRAGDGEAAGGRWRSLFLFFLFRYLLFVPGARASWAPRRGAAAPPPLTHRFGSCFPGILFFNGVPGVLSFCPGLVSGVDSVAFRRRLSGYSAISGVVWELGAQGIPRTLMPEGGRRGRRTRSRCPGPSRSSAKYALWDSRQLPLISLIGWELGYR